MRSTLSNFLRMERGDIQSPREQIFEKEERIMAKEIPVWEKYTLSIEEAADYFRIGQKRLRQMVAENPDAEYILMNGNRVQIKRKLFEQYIDMATVV